MLRHTSGVGIHIGHVGCVHTEYDLNSDVLYVALWDSIDSIAIDVASFIYMNK